MIPLHEMRFRSSPFVDLKQLADLAPEQREPFRELESDADFFGLLVPRPPLRMNIKSVARQTADLFRSLANAAHLDGTLLADEEYRNDVVDLVLDGVLEVERGGAFLSGADALTAVCPSVEEPGIHNAAARLSRDALLHAQDLETRDPQVLTTALYLYNRIPMSPFWKARFPDGNAVLAHLGADRGPLRVLIDRDWIAHPPGSSRGWLSWHSKTPVAREAGGVTHKLYVSPRPEQIREAFEVVVRVLAGFPGAQFKVGDDASGLLRPDKLVSYFVTREQLDEAAAVLSRELAGCAAHGVPFTAGIDDAGLLSRGIDPPDSDRALSWLGRESWRLWVVQHLASALALAKSARSANAVEPWRFAIERVRRQGVNVETWTPSPALWSLL
jgi:hypothetical protein